MEEGLAGFGEFSIEMADIEVRKVVDWNSITWETSEGGSIDTKAVIKDGKLFFGCYNHIFYALDIGRRDVAWKFETQGRIVMSHPVIYKDTVIFGSFDQNLYCIDLATGGMRWKFRTRGEIASTGAVFEDTFFFTCRDMIIYAVDCRTGSLVWKFRTYGPNVSAPTVHKGMVYFGCSDRNLYCIDCRTGSLAWKLETEEEIANPVPFVIRDDVIYFGTLGDMLYAVDVRSRRILWKFNTGQYGTSRGGAVIGDTLLQPTNGGILYALSFDGRVKWKFIRNETVGSVSTDGERIYLSGGDNFNLYCLDRDGNEIWTLRTSAPIWNQAVISEGKVYIGCYDCSMYVLDAINGKLLWKFKTPGGIATYPDLRGIYEARIRIDEREAKEDRKARYNLSTLKEEVAEGRFYKSRITYQSGTQYREKGKYQTDSDE